MRVISGSARGTVLAGPRTAKFRPTSDRVKKVIFDTLYSLSAAPLRVMDAFAGSGSLGIEALSRGAERAVFIEKSRKIAQILQRNIEKAHLVSRAEVWIADALVALRPAAAQSCDVIFADPPYESGLGQQFLQLVASTEWLAKNGVFVLEESHRCTLHPPEGMHLLKKKLVGDTAIWFFRKV